MTLLICSANSVHGVHLIAKSVGEGLFLNIDSKSKADCYVNNSSKSITFVCNKPIENISKNSLYNEYFVKSSISKDKSRLVLQIKDPGVFAVKTSRDHNSFKIVGKKKITSKIELIQNNQSGKTKNKPTANKQSLKVNNNPKTLNNPKIQNTSPNLLKSQAQQIQDMVSNVAVFSDENYFSLEFPVSENVATAVFAREKYIWVVFNKNLKFDLSAIEKNFSDVRIMPNPQNLILRFRHNLSGEMKSNFKDGKWVVKLLKNLKVSLTPMVTLSEYSNPAARGISFLIDGSAAPVTVQDPDVQDKITIVPIYKSGIGVPIKRSFVDFDLLKTAQGLVVLEKSDNIKILASENHLEIVSPNYVSDLDAPGNVLDTTKDLLEKNISPLGDGIKTLLPYFDGIKYLDRNFLKDHTDLIRKIITSKPEDLNKNRFDMVRFFFKHEMFREALSYSEVITKADKDFFNQSLRAKFLKAVLYIFDHNYMEASRLLDQVSQDKDLPEYFVDEVELWKSYNLANQDIPIDNIGYVKNADKFLFVYPDTLQWDIALKELELLVYKQPPSEKNLKDAAYIIDNLNNPPKRNPHYLENTIAFLNGKYNVVIGETDAAKVYFNDLRLDWTDPQNRSRSEFELVKILIKEGSIEQKEAIQRLEKAGTLWRGDNSEYELMFYIAGLYKQNKELIKSMRIYDYIIHNFSKDSRDIGLTAEMVKIFNEIFRPGGYVEVLDDFTAVSLFNEFRELTPIGVVGDQIVISIAKRLLNLDLLDSAEALLKYQVDYRLKEDEKVMIASNLALIYIINNKPDKAIEVLNQTDKYNYSYREYLERLRVRASAFVKQEKYQQALQLISQDSNFEANLLREEIFFKQERWQELISLLEPRLMDKLINKQEFADYENKDLIKLAISYALTQKYNKLTYMKNNLQSPNQIVIQVIDYLSYHQVDLNLQDIAGTSGVSHFSEFLDLYKKKLF